MLRKTKLEKLEQVMKIIEEGRIFFKRTRYKSVATWRT